jgi:hypothetical protein
MGFSAYHQTARDCINSVTKALKTKIQQNGTSGYCKVQFQQLGPNFSATLRTFILISKPLIYGRKPSKILRTH